MTLRDKIALAGDYSLIIEEEVKVIEKISDDYAVEFAGWLMVNCDYKKHCVWEYKGIEYTNFELLEIFKKEKGL